jgi:hypothetical protein
VRDSRITAIAGVSLLLASSLREEEQSNMDFKDFSETSIEHYNLKKLG